MIRILCIVLTAFTVVMTRTTVPAGGAEDLEESVCGPIKEPLAFWLWSRAAGEPSPEAAARVPNAEPVIHKTKDGRLLRGYKLTSTAEEVAGFVLVAQGNAMLADQLLPSLSAFPRAGIEAYVFDYRGYGRSEGKPRLKAIVSDYMEIFNSVSASTAGVRLLYGISFGGVVLLNVVGSGMRFDRAVIDSTPSRVSSFGCPVQYDPIANLPQDGSRFLLIAGGQDEVVPLKDSQALLDLAEARGARTEVRPEYAHPFMDREMHTHRARLNLIVSFLSGAVTQEAQ